MLIGGKRPRSDLAQVRRIKETLRAALSLSSEDTVTVSELACLEEGCAPVETVVGLLSPGVPSRQHKLYKPASQVDAEDLRAVCVAWGLAPEGSALAGLTKETR